MPCLSVVHKTDKPFFPFLYVTRAPPVPIVSGSNPALVTFVTAAFCTSVVHVLWGSQTFYVHLWLIALYSIPRKGKRNKNQKTFQLIWRSMCQRSLLVGLIKTVRANSELQSERCAAPALQPPVWLLVFTDAYVASLPVLCTKLPSLLAVRYRSGFPHVAVGLHLSAQVAFFRVLAVSPYLVLRAVSELTLINSHFGILESFWKKRCM